MIGRRLLTISRWLGGYVIEHGQSWTRNTALEATIRLISSCRSLRTLADYARPASRRIAGDRATRNPPTVPLMGFDHIDRRTAFECLDLLKDHVEHELEALAFHIAKMRRRQDIGERQQGVARAN